MMKSIVILLIVSGCLSACAQFTSLKSFERKFAAAGTANGNIRLTGCYSFSQGDFNGPIFFFANGLMARCNFSGMDSLVTLSTFLQPHTTDKFRSNYDWGIYTVTHDSIDVLMYANVSEAGAKW